MKCTCYLTKQFQRKEGEVGSLEPKLFKCSLCVAAPELYEALKLAKEAIDERELPWVSMQIAEALATVEGK